MQRTKVKCEICGREISKSNITKHLNSHKNKLIKEDNKYKLDHDDLFCKFCGKECKNRNSLCNHERLCKENLNRQESVRINFNNFGRVAWNKGLTKDTDERVAKSVDTYKSNHLQGKHKSSNYWMLDEDKLKIANEKRRLKALEHHLGWSNTGRNIDYNGIKLSSSFEVIVAKELDDNDIKWERPKGYSYIGPDNINRNYVPDFYLPDFNVFLEPKNDYLINNVNPYLGFYDIEKIKCCSKQNRINVILLTKDELNWETILYKINNNIYVK